ncbi:MAG TPA: cytochrome c family protein [Thermohalobaculum sp.]|nr:cytochrome c family protein [Thermohalobaculum sp.]
MTIRNVLLAGAVCLAAGGTALADGDAAKGEKVFRKCKACHTVEEGKNRVGPSLFAVVGRPVAAIGDYKYSDAMRGFGDGKTWTPELLDAYLAKPKDLVPGTKMTFQGLKAEADRADVIAYLAGQG